MAILLVEGFDLYNGIGANTGVASKWLGAGTGTSLVSGRFGGQALRVTWQSSSERLFYKEFTPTTTLGLGVAIRFTSLPSTDGNYGHIYLQSGTTHNIAIRATTGGAISVSRNTASTTGTVLGTSSSGVVSTNTWHYLEVRLVVNDTTGSIVVLLDGNQIINVTNVDTNNAVTTVNRLVLGHYSTALGQGNFEFDDLYLLDTATTLGERRVETLRPAADTAQKDFARSAGSDNFALVDETTSNGDTDYVQGSAVGNLDRYTIGALSSTPSTISAVQLTAFALKTDAATRNIALHCRSGATDSDGPNYALAASYTKFDRILETDPATSAAWTTTGVNSLLIGPKVTV